MTPAEELRAAAARLRETAKGAPRGPWEFVENLYWGRDAIVNPEAMGWDALVLSVHDLGETPVARWAALVHPGLAEPLADLLEFLSGCIEYDAKRGRSGTMREEYALAVARVINGGPPTVWSDAVPPGGQVCAVYAPGRPDDICGMPVESEPCPDHGSAL